MGHVSVELSNHKRKSVQKAGITNVGDSTKISSLVKPCQIKFPICRIALFSLFSCLPTGSYIFLPLIRPKGGRASSKEPAGIPVLLFEGCCDTGMYRNPGGMGSSDTSPQHRNPNCGPRPQLNALETLEANSRHRFKTHSEAERE